MKLSRFYSLVAAITIAWNATSSNASLIGVDAVHGFNDADNLGAGSNYSQFRAAITNAGNNIVPLFSFDAANLAGLDGVILKIPYSQNNANYTASQIAALQAFARREVFVSDSSMWSNIGDRPITFGDNQQLLRNIVDYISTKGVLATGDGGTGIQVDNFNVLVARYGITYSATATDGSGRTISGFAAHAVTTGIQTVGVDFQLPLTVTAPSIDLTLGAGQDDILAVATVPEPSTALLAVLGTAVFWRRRNGAQLSCAWTNGPPLKIG